MQQTTPFDDGRHKLIVPGTHQSLFTLEQLSVIKSVGLEPMLVQELALANWLELDNREYVDTYDRIVEEVTDSYDDSPECEAQQANFEQETDAVFQIVLHAHSHYSRFLGDIPKAMDAEGAPRFPYINVETENVNADYTVLVLFGEDNTV